MGTPSDGKKFPPDKKCENCDTILIGDEVRLCDDCKEQKTILIGDEVRLCDDCKEQKNVVDKH